jgi:hypothetical protein
VCSSSVTTPRVADVLSGEGQSQSIAVDMPVAVETPNDGEGHRCVIGKRPTIWRRIPMLDPPLCNLWISAKALAECVANGKTIQGKRGAVHADLMIVWQHKNSFLLFKQQASPYVPPD